MNWYDPGRGLGVVEHNGRKFAAVAEDVDRDARTAGLPVHFDIEHSRDGDLARNVTARPRSAES